ncbi:unnamed protein product [Agarophyton chilense]
MMKRCCTFVVVLLGTWATVGCALAPLDVQAVPPVSKGGDVGPATGPVVRQMEVMGEMGEGMFTEVIDEVDGLMASATPEMMMTASPEVDYMEKAGEIMYKLMGTPSVTDEWTPQPTASDMYMMYTAGAMTPAPTYEDVLYMTPSASPDAWTAQPTTSDMYMMYTAGAMTPGPTYEDELYMTPSASPDMVMQ